MDPQACCPDTRLTQPSGECSDHLDISHEIFLFVTHDLLFQSFYAKDLLFCLLNNYIFTSILYPWEKLSFTRGTLIFIYSITGKSRYAFCLQVLGRYSRLWIWRNEAMNRRRIASLTFLTLILFLYSWADNNKWPGSDMCYVLTGHWAVADILAISDDCNIDA